MARDSDAPAHKKRKQDIADLPVCPYGSKCYRKNPVHFKEFSHPSDKDAAKKQSSSTPVDTSTLPPCPFGAKCYRKNLVHFAQFSHPIKSNDIPSDDSGSDTDVYDDDEDEQTPSTSKLQKSSSLIKKYSQMTEEERKELIKKAFEMKDRLEKELEETKAEVEAKSKELKMLQSEVNKGVLLMEGEAEALEKNEVKYFDMMAERKYKEGSAAQLHFRLAESQFYRLMSAPGTASAGYRVMKVQYVVNPPLVKRFKKARERLAKERGEEYSYPILAFHGTKVENITPICENGFKVPGDKGFEHRTDAGFWGRGAYFSEFPGFSIGYILGATKLLLCQILTGKVFHCSKMITGKPLMKGYDSHCSLDKKELVIFHNEHILPCYIVHYAKSSTEFKYLVPKEDLKFAKDTDDLMKLYWKAKRQRKSKLLSNHHIRLLGDLCDDHLTIGQLIRKHGGSFIEKDPPPTKDNRYPITNDGVTYQFYEGKYMACCHILITTEKIAKAGKDKLLRFAQQQATSALQTTIVRQEWLFDCIIKKEHLEPESYRFD